MMAIISDWILFLVSFALAFQVFTLINYLRNRYYITAIPKENQKKDDSSTSRVISVCIPARNEAHNIEKTIDSLLKQTRAPLEILVLDDQSTDGTLTLVQEIAQNHATVNVFIGKEKPTHWLGKNWACHQLSQHAKGSVLLFLDADVWLSTHTIDLLERQFQHFDAITVWPQQILGSFFEHLVVPGVYYSLLTLFPAAYINQKPRWLPKGIYPYVKHLFTAANGQFLAIKKTPYHEIGGHQSVKSEVVDDMALAKNLKLADFRLGMFHGAHTVYCRMYKNAKEVWEGFSKNFMSGFPNSIVFIMMAMVHIICFIFPFLFVFIPALRLHSTAPDCVLYASVVSVAIFTFIRIHLSTVFKWKQSFSFFHVGTVLWFQILGIVLLWKRIIGKKNRWKGREIS
ncbi:MAG: glycosyltransferase family 2 protein [Bacteroidota bacterium]